MDALRSRFSPDPAGKTVAGHPVVVCRPVETLAELAEHHRLRRAVFVSEQGLFDTNDRDEHDDDPATIHILGFEDSAASGTVRLYPTPSLGEPHLWKGDRLAVRSGHRHSGLGGPLVRQAVALAESAGGARMVAWVQLDNVRFFQHLGWKTVGVPEPYVGTLHQQMSIRFS